MNTMSERTEQNLPVTETPCEEQIFPDAEYEETEAVEEKE